MSKKTSILDKEIAKLLKATREKAGLYQAEIAKRIGLSNKSGKGYISHLEKGRVKNPPIGTILLYLRACGESWSEFFKHLDMIDFRTRHIKMIAKVNPPLMKRKIERDAMKYEIGIEFPAKEKPKRDIDFDRLKSRIESKVSAYLIKNRVEGNQAFSYHKFVREYFDFLATLNKSGMKAVTEKYQRAGLKTNLLFGLKKIINNVLRAEIKRISAQKPLPTKKYEKMAIGFTKYRIIIERIEAEVHKLLCELEVPTPWFTLYKDFARQCYQVLKKYYNKDIKKLTQSLNELVTRWQKEGLKEDILMKLKDKIIFTFTELKIKKLV